MCQKRERERKRTELATREKNLAITSLSGHFATLVLLYFLLHEPGIFSVPTSRSRPSFFFAFLRTLVWPSSEFVREDSELQRVDNLAERTVFHMVARLVFTRRETRQETISRSGVKRERSVIDVCKGEIIVSIHPISIVLSLSSIPGCSFHAMKAPFT